MKKRIFSIVLAAVLLAACLPVTASAANVWNGSSASWFAGGSGTASNPYQIATGDQLAYLAKQVNAGNSFTGKYFVLTADIDLNGRAWTPIGCGLQGGDAVMPSYPHYYDDPALCRPFGGVFDGLGHTISNLWVEEYDMPGVGLFGYLACCRYAVTGDYCQHSQPVIRNLHVTGAYVSGGSLVGGIVGTSEGIVENCSFRGNVYAESDCAGGIVGINNHGHYNGQILNCINYGAISADVNSCGGIAGRSAGPISGCVNYGTVSGVNQQGGITGFVAWSEIKRCVNLGEVIGEYQSGGIAGNYWSYSNIMQCYNEGNIYAEEEAGGLAGHAFECLCDCYNVGDVSAAAYAGGLIGYACDSVSFATGMYRNYSAGKVSGEGGALFGCLELEYTVVEDCYYLESSGLPPVAEGSTMGLFGLTSAELRSDWIVMMLNGSRSIWSRSDRVNSGYPVLYFASNWASSDVQKADDEGLLPDTIKGKDLTKPVTRGEFTAISVRLYEAVTGKSLQAVQVPFTDIASDPNAADIRKAYGLGVINGMTATTFEPDTLMSREQLATLLTRVCKIAAWPDWTLAADASYPLDWSGVRPFADDAYISAYAKPSVYYMVKNGIINGVGNNYFAPKNTTAAQEASYYANATREQALILALRVLRDL